MSNLGKTVQNLKKDPLSKITIVFGNESCDLDSAVCAITLAHHLNEKMNIITLPILNIEKDDVPLKTEVKFSLGGNHIDLIPTQTDLDFDQLCNAEIMLVDHHKLIPKYSSLQSKIIEIIDHRQIDPSANFPDGCKTTIELVGSCSSLVADKLIKEGYKVN